MVWLCCMLLLVVLLNAVILQWFFQYFEEATVILQIFTMIFLQLEWCVMLLDLSYQAAQQVLSAPVASALHLLRDISQNFPSRARSVGHT